MSGPEQEVLDAVYELGGGQQSLIPFDVIAQHLETTLTAIKSFSFVLQTRNLATVTFGGVQLTVAGIEQAKNEREIYSD